MIVLSGGESVLANYILPIIRENYQVCAFGSEKGDIRDNKFIERLIDEVKPKYFINTVQFNDIVKCEIHREEAYHVNAFAIGELAKLCKERDITLIQISSTYVYSGDENIEYTEEDLINPNTTYGDSVALGEKLIKKSGCKHLILRIPNLYGNKDSFLDKYISEIINNKEIKIIKDQVISVVSAEDIAFVIKYLIENNEMGTYNYSNEPPILIKDFLYEVLEILNKVKNKNYNLKIKEVSIDEYYSIIDWPKYNKISLDKIKSVEKNICYNWKDSINKYFNKKYNLS